MLWQARLACVGMLPDSARQVERSGRHAFGTSQLRSTGHVVSFGGASDDDSDKIYWRPDARSAILVRAPDESAVHMRLRLLEFQPKIFCISTYFK